MPLLSKASNFVQNVFFLYDVTSFTQIRHSIPVATSCSQIDRRESRQTMKFLSVTSTVAVGVDRAGDQVGLEAKQEG